jgi:ATP phosphoribosyltransferase
MTIIIDGNDGTGKSTLVASLRALGFEASDRGLPTKATINGLPEKLPENEVYVILDLPEEISRERLAKAGKDLEEEWHTMESLTLYRGRFREIAEALRVPLISAEGTAEEVLTSVKSYLGIKGDPKIGIPSGHLGDTVGVIMHRAQHELKRQDRNLRPKCANIDPFLLKPRSIPQMVAYGLLDGGFCGRDLLEESSYGEQIHTAVDLKTHPVTLTVAAADPWILNNLPKRPLRIATEFPQIASRWATSKGLAHMCINTWGSTEAWVPEFCDIIIDVVETGNTLRANGLHVIDKLFESTTLFVVNPNSPMRHHQLITALSKVALAKSQRRDHP